MEKNRILSLTLSVLMLVTLMLPVDAFAEEYEELLYEEPVYEDYIEEPVFEEYSEEEPVYEDFIVDETVIEDLTEDSVILEENVQAGEISDTNTTDEETAYFELFDTTVYDASSTISITSQPVNAKGNAGDNVSFTVEASGVSAYQWQYSKTGVGGWKSCGEATANEATLELLNITASTKATCYFRCMLTGTDGTAEYTDVVRIEDADIVFEPFVFKIIEGTNNLALIGYTGSASSVEVPDSVDGMTVTEIGVSPLGEGEKGVFEGNTTLTSIKLPNTITAIREKSFKGCTNLSTMTTY